MLKSLVDRPHYVFRPTQAVRRVSKILRPPQKAPEFQQTTLPWGMRLRFRPRDHIGQFLYYNGLYDVCVSETLYRLAARGEIAADIGANIGQMTSILAARTKRGGKVYAFEPHPEIFQELATNVDLWRAHPDAGYVVLHQVALSDNSGNGHLQMTVEFEHNRGTSSVVVGDHAPDGATKTHLVPLRRLDDIVPPEERIGTAKLDVEGHELEVLKGATRLLETGRIRDLVFEDYGTPPTPVMQLLEAHGYELFSVRPRFFGLTVAKLKSEVMETAGGPPSYLATRDAARALSLLRKPGWAVFGLCRI